MPASHEIRFVHDREVCWTAWPSGTVLLSYGAIRYRIQAGDRIFWSLVPAVDGGRFATLSAWVVSVHGSIWQFLDLQVRVDAAVRVRARLLEALTSLAQLAKVPLTLAPQGPACLQLVGTVQSTGVCRGKTLAAWNGIPAGSPFAVLAVAGLARAVQVCPGWSPSRCWSTGVDAGQQARLQAGQALLEASAGATVALTGGWSALRHVEPERPDQPRQRPVRLAPLTPIDLPELETLCAAAGDDTPAAPEPLSQPVWQPIAPEVFFWCATVRRL